jgi:hypothetical protein
VSKDYRHEQGLQAPGWIFLERSSLCSPDWSGTCYPYASASKYWVCRCAPLASNKWKF